MHMLKGAAIAAALLLTACQTGGGTGNGGALTTAEKALTAAHLGHEAAADLASTAAKSGLLTGSNATTAKSLLDQSETYLVAADAALKLGDAVTAEAQAANATQLVGQIEALATKH